jgi:hypothetical protein
MGASHNRHALPKHWTIPGEQMQWRNTARLCGMTMGALIAAGATAQEWKPTKNVDIVVSSGAGRIARQAIEATSRCRTKNVEAADAWLSTELVYFGASQIDHGFHVSSFARSLIDTRQWMRSSSGG